MPMADARRAASASETLEAFNCKLACAGVKAAFREPVMDSGVGPSFSEPREIWMKSRVRSSFRS
jgi:hypothetical protein